MAKIDKAAAPAKAKTAAPQVEPKKKEAIAKPTMTKAASKPITTKVESKQVEEKEDTGSYTGVVNREKYGYKTHKDQKTASGRASVDNDDPLAAALRGKTAKEVVSLVEDNGGEVNPSWEKLNQGLARMSAGNVLRKLAKRSEGIKIDGKTLKIAA